MILVEGCSYAWEYYLVLMLVNEYGSEVCDNSNGAGCDG